MKRRVVVTGLGHISPVGNTVEEGWANIKKGQSGIAHITKFDASNFPTHFAGEVKNFNPEDHFEKKEVKKMDTFIHYGLVAGIQTIEDSGVMKDKNLIENNELKENKEPKFNQAFAERIGIIIGSGIGGLPRIEETGKTLIEKGCRGISPFFVPGSIINMIAGHLSIKYGIKGPNLAIVTACTTGTHSIGEAMRMIVYGDADVMIAGGAESTISPLGIGGFAAVKALSTRNDEPTKASRPWDKNRDGFVLGEGAGVLVLEEYEHAKARNAKIYCELKGYGRSGDAYHITSPDSEGAQRCMKAALKDANIKENEVNYINAHGTSTGLGDLSETLAIKNVFGNHAKKLVTSSTKSMTGHLLGAAGGIEAVYTALAIRDQISPPTINHENPDPECDLDYCPNVAREMKIDVALSNSFGFGGTNGTLVFKKIDD